VTLIFGVGKMSQQRLARDGLHTVGDLARSGERELRRRYGAEGARLARLSRGFDDRPVKPDRETKSISAETTFDRDIADFRPLELHLWQLCEKVSARLKHSALAGSSITLKLKTADFRIRTRAQSLAHPTQLAALIFFTGRELLGREIDGTRFRLIGIGVSTLCAADGADLGDFIDRRAAQTEQAIDRLREKFGNQAVIKGLAFDRDNAEQKTKDG
jgi:DNA polymerase-4